MKTQKGYILPVIFILTLLVLAGIIVFTEKKIEPQVPEKREDTVIATSTLFIATSTIQVEDENDDSLSDDLSGTSTATTTVDVSITSSEVLE